MKDVFAFRKELIERYAEFSRGVQRVHADDIRAVFEEMDGQKQAYWPDPLIQLNLSYKPGASVSKLVEDGTLHPDCQRIFSDSGAPLNLYRPQLQAINSRLVLLNKLIRHTTLADVWREVQHGAIDHRLTKDEIILQSLTDWKANAKKTK